MQLLKVSATLLAISSLISHSFGQELYSPNPDIDVRDYHFYFHLSDYSDTISGNAEIQVFFPAEVKSFYLDLASAGRTGTGMHVSSVTLGGKPVEFTHQEDRLTIACSDCTGNSTRTVRIEYKGIPEDGLIISKNRFGARTYFGDNWPNRAHEYLPCIDHPGDKATVTFTIDAPSDYQVVANGSLLEETNLSEHVTRTTWSSKAPIPTKVMVFGAAHFAVQYLGEVSGVPLSNWVYPQNRDQGFSDYAVARDILQFCIDSIGPYPYAKLANVQSTTRYGGMENASAIFYAENSVTGTGSATDVIAHEIPHQWFGNCVTESGWPHLWLSEGLATYIENMYFEITMGQSTARSRLMRDRELVTTFARRWRKPVVDSATVDYRRLLNPNSYEKGAWVLHMLRRKVGDAAFWNILRTFYAQYKHSNASTEQFRQVAEQISGMHLETFFHQWLFTAGHPVLKLTHEPDHTEYRLQIMQKQQRPFIFDLDLRFVFTDGSHLTETVHIEGVQSAFAFTLPSNPVKVILDPDTWLLFEEE